MAHNDIEIEVKFPLKNTPRVRAFLEQKAEGLKADVVQKDTYYIPAHRDFLAPEYPFEWPRLRETSRGASMNYKHFHPENTKVTEYCDEFETALENPASAAKIFAALDMKPAIVVNKSRSTWLYMDVEIAIDDVDELGSFIELEATTPFATPEEGTKYLHSVLEELGAELGAQDFRGYPYLLLEKRKTKE